MRLQYEAKRIPTLRSLSKVEYLDPSRVQTIPECRSIPEELKQAFRKAVWLCSDWSGDMPEPEVAFPMGPEKASATARWAAAFKEMLPNDVYSKLLSMIGPAAKDRLIKSPSYETGGRVLIDWIHDISGAHQEPTPSDRLR
jgi:hypothetical protein